MNRSSLLAAFLAAAGLAVLLLATRRDLTEPHLRLFSDMVYSPADKSQGENPIFRDGQTEQAPPPGTVARDFYPLHYGEGEAERERAGRELKNPFKPTLENMKRGRFVFESFCSHCHGLTGLGNGAVAKDFPGFSFPIATKSTYDLPDGTIFHIITYGRNLMPAHGPQIAQADRWKLILYLRDLQRQEIARLGPRAIIPEDPRARTLVSADYGKELFAQNCASCHGAEGLHPKPGIPTLHSPAVLAIADDQYYWDIINHGRPGTLMPAWRSVLTPTQIQSLVAHIRSWASPAPGAGGPVLAGDALQRGHALFTTHCVGCHGVDGKGGIGNSLNTPSFLALASDRFLHDTIALGRHHTAMPASYDLKAGDVDALVAYIRAWAKPNHTDAQVLALIPAADPTAGKKLFDAKCAGCHGDDGSGGVGSSLSAASFLPMVDDRFLVRVIDDGRPGTAMPAWHSLSAQDVANVVSYVRRWQKGPAIALSTATRAGRAEFGEVLFKQNCVKCHGQFGEGDLGTQIGNPVLLTQESDEFLWRTIAYGKTGTDMKGFLKRPRDPLSERDIDHVIAYLRQMQQHPPAQALKRHYSWASAKDGKKVYDVKANCASCHGPHGEGGIGPSLGTANFLRVASDDFLAGTIILGREGTKMKSYHNGAPPNLEEEDVENVIAYVRAFEKDPPKETRRVDRSAENVLAGRALFKENCARCHGDNGQGRHGLKPGTFAPSLHNEEFLKAADDNFLLATIALGRPGTPMRAFGDGMNGQPGLTADQIRQVVAFLRSWEKGR